MILVKASDADDAISSRLQGGERWGLLDPARRPLHQSDIKIASAEISNMLELTFKLHTDSPASVTSTTTRIARSQIFRKILLEQYNYKCCVSDICLATLNDTFEAQAAHVAPLGSGGSDDPRKGIV